MNFFFLVFEEKERGKKRKEKTRTEGKKEKRKKKKRRKGALGLVGRDLVDDENNSVRRQLYVLVFSEMYLLREYCCHNRAETGLTLRNPQASSVALFLFFWPVP